MDERESESQEKKCALLHRRAHSSHRLSAAVRFAAVCGVKEEEFFFFSFFLSFHPLAFDRNTSNERQSHNATRRISQESAPRGRLFSTWRSRS